MNRQTGHFSFGGQPCKLRCPKCRKQNLHISEVWNGNGIYFTVQNGVMPHDADDHFAGSPVRLESRCADCNHCWTVRGIASIFDVVADAAESPTNPVAPTATEAGKPLTLCAADRDNGMCTHQQCPQLRDDEPRATGRHCPLDTHPEEE